MGAVHVCHIDAPRKALIGACVVSAAGSLPLHLMPFMVALAAADGLLSVGQAGWIGSGFMAGLLLATLGLPLLGCRRVIGSAALSAALTLVAALAFGATSGTTALLIGWVVVGCVCGLLHFLGSTVAAASPDRHFVFGLRLALVLFAAAMVMAGAALAGGFRSYGTAAAILGGSFLAACSLGLAWYRPPRAAVGQMSTSAGGATSRGSALGLLVVVLFFAGQPGFMAYSAHLAISHGIEPVSLPLVYALGKVAGGIVLLRWGARQQGGAPGFVAGVVLAAAVIAMAEGHHVAVFALGLLSWEMAVNLQSTRLQAVVVAQHPEHAGRWIAAAVSIGAAAGPAVHGALLDHAAGRWFVAYSVLAGLLPAAWAVHRARRQSARGIVHDVVPRRLS